MGHPRATVLLFLGVILFVSSAPRADGAWIENDIQILSLSEVRSRLSGTAIESSLSETTPVLVPPGWDATHPADLRAILSLSGLALRREASGETVFAPHDLIDETGAATRRRPVSPTPPPADADGAIVRGAVILHGEFFEPPFHVLSNDAGIRINGVAVFPVPGPNVPPPVPTAAQEQSHAAREAAFEAYRETMAEGDPISARTQLRAHALTIPDVRSARWDGDQALILERENGTEEVIYVGDDFRSPDPPSAEDMRAAFDAQAESMRQILRDDRTLLLGATYTLAILEPDAPRFELRLEEIMASGEDGALKLARIQAYTAHRESATDIFLAARGGGR